MVLRAAAVRDFDGTRLTLAVANEEIRQNTDQITQGIKGALEHEFRTPITVVWVVDASLAGASGAPAPASLSPRVSAPPVPHEAPEEYEEPAGGQASGTAVNSVAEYLITEMVPGAEEIS